MSKSDRRPVGLLLEGVVILLSILAAFFLEGWGTDRELARDLDQELASVQAELERNRDLVAFERATLGRILDSGDALISALAEADTPFVPVVDTVVFVSTGWHTSFSPSMGAVDALISSGRLAQVADPELRLLLAGLRDFVADAFEEEEFARDIGVNRLGPLLGEHVDMSLVIGVSRSFIDSSSDTIGRTPQERAVSRGLVSAGSVSFPTNLPVRNTILTRQGWLSSAYTEFGSLEQYLERMIELVTAERVARDGGLSGKGPS